MDLQYNLEGRVKLSDDVRFTTDDTGAILLDLKHGKCFAVNTLGAEICTAIQGGRPYGHVFDAVCLKFQDVAPDRIAVDLRAFLADLLTKGLLDTNQGQQVS
jgi:hypothetical protein